MKIIKIQPEPFVDNVWVSPQGDIVEGKKTPYPFHVRASDGHVEDQDFWRGNPSKVVGFQIRKDVQRVDFWFVDIAETPDLMVGKYPVMVGPEGLYTYMTAIKSVEVIEVPA